MQSVKTMPLVYILDLFSHIWAVYEIGEILLLLRLVFINKFYRSGMRKHIPPPPLPLNFSLPTIKLSSPRPRWIFVNPCETFRPCQTFTINDASLFFILHLNKQTRPLTNQIFTIHFWILQRNRQTRSLTNQTFITFLSVLPRNVFSFVGKPKLKNVYNITLRF